MIFKVLSRTCSYARGVWLKIKIVCLGGKCYGVPKVGPNVYWKYPPHQGIELGRGIEIGPGCYFDIPVLGKLIVGEGVKLTGGVYLASIKEINIGRNSLIAEYCSIRDAEHLTDPSLPINKQGSVSKKVFIGDDVWLGKGVTVLMGVTIKHGSIIGANSLVKNTVIEEFLVYAGIPARLIKKRK